MNFRQRVNLSHTKGRNSIKGPNNFFLKNINSKNFEEIKIPNNNKAIRLQGIISKTNENFLPKIDSSSQKKIQKHDSFIINPFKQRIRLKSSKQDKRNNTEKKN